MNIRELISKLEDSPGMIFDIFDMRSGRRIEPANISYQSLEDPEGFFLTMLEKFGEIQVQLKETRGNSSRNPRAAMIVKKEGFPSNNYSSPQKEFPSMHPRSMHIETGLNGFAGLNGPEVLSSMIDAKSLRTENRLLQDNLDAAKKLNSSLETQLKESKLKNSQLEVQNQTLETLKNLEKEKALIEHESGLSKFLGKVDPSQVIPVLAMFAKAPPPPPSPGLAGVENLSDHKKGIIQLVSEDFFQDSHAALLLKIAEHMATQDGFAEQLNSVVFGSQSQDPQPTEESTTGESLTVVS